MPHAIVHLTLSEGNMMVMSGVLGAVLTRSNVEIVIALAVAGLGFWIQMYRLVGVYRKHQHYKLTVDVDE